MKPSRPKSLTPPSAVGQGLSRALDMVGAPFLTKRVGQTVAVKAGEFSWVQTGTAKAAQLLVGMTSGASGYHSAWRPANPFRAKDLGSGQERTSSPVQLYAPGGISEASGANPGTSFVYLGGGYVLWMRLYVDDTPYTDYSSVKTDCWPVVSYVGAPGEESLPAAEGRSYALFQSLNFHSWLVGLGSGAIGLGTAMHLHCMSTFSLGRNSDGGYVYGVSGIWHNTALNVSQFIIAVGNTVDRDLNVKYSYTLSYPGININESFGHFFCTGPGQARGFYMKSLGYDDQYQTISPPMTAKILATADFGESWSFQDCPELSAAFGPQQKQNYLGNGYMGATPDPSKIALHVVMGYLGGGKHFLYYPHMSGPTCTVAEISTSSLPFVGKHTSHGLFVSDGGAYTEVDWPAKNWFQSGGGIGWMSFLTDPGYTTGAGYSGVWRLPNINTEFYYGVSSEEFYADDSAALERENQFGSNPVYGPTIGWTADDGRRACQWAFGEGCLAVPFREWGPQKWGVLFTHDFGETWSSAYLPEAVWPRSYRSPCITIISPYKSESSPGEILFTEWVEGTSKAKWYKTSGKFDRFKILTGANSGGEAEFPHIENDGMCGDIVMYIHDGSKFTPTFPAFPNEFNGA
jgi:hypothetical protein